MPPPYFATFTAKRAATTSGNDAEKYHASRNIVQHNNIPFAGY
jgi:hypothetical protein